MKIKQKLLILRGASASGKTTWAEKFVQEDRTFQNFNRDDFRAMLCGSRGIWTQGEKFENLVTNVQVAGVEAALKAGYNVIISDTNLSLRALKLWVNVASKYRAELEINDSFLQVPLETCLERDSKRLHPVGASVIKKQFKMLANLPKLEDIQPSRVEAVSNNPNLKKCLVFDLDGTAALFEKEDKNAPNYRNPYDASTCENDLPNMPVLKTIDLFAKDGYTVFAVSGRDSKYKSQTEAWLAKYNVKYDGLFMRPTGDSRKDSVIKKEIYLKEILPHYYVEAVLDDRDQVVSMLRNELGLTVFQVAEGNF